MRCGSLRRVWVALLLLLAASPSTAGILRVPAEFATIQAAVDASAPGDVIQLKPGRYSESVRIEGRERLTVRGGRGVEIEPPEDIAFKVVDSSRVALERLTIFGSLGIEAVGIVGSRNVIVRRCRFVGGSEGVHVWSDGPVRIERNDFEAQVGKAVVLDGGRLPPAVDSVVSKNRFFLTVGVGVLVKGQFNRIERNRFEGVVEGEAVSGDSDAVGNRYVRNRLLRAGFWTNGTGERVERNRSVDSSYTGFGALGPDSEVIRNRVQGAEDCVVIGDGGRAVGNVCNDTVFGISAGTGGEVVGNRIRRPGSYGVRVGQDCVVEDNDVRDSLVDGFFVAGGGNVVRRNRARGSGRFDLVDESATDTNEYRQNRFQTMEIVEAP